MTQQTNQNSIQTNEEKSLNSEPQGSSNFQNTDPGINENEKSESNDNQKVRNTSQIKKKENQTDKVKWSIFTDIETKTISHKAAKKAGLKLNEWIDRALREKGTEELTKKAEPPAKTEDLVKDIVSQFAEKFEASQEATRQAQTAMIEQQGRQIADLTKAISEQPKNWKEMLFGKKSS